MEKRLFFNGICMTPHWLPISSKKKCSPIIFPNPTPPRFPLRNTTPPPTSSAFHRTLFKPTKKRTFLHNKKKKAPFQYPPILQKRKGNEVILFLYIKTIFESAKRIKSMLAISLLKKEYIVRIWDWKRGWRIRRMGGWWQKANNWLYFSRSI